MRREPLRSNDEAESARAAIAGRAKPPIGTFDLTMVARLPEIAQRYFAHAIAPGTPLRTTVQLEMQGTFLLGDRAKYQTYAMTARQILAPPSEFVWLPSMRSGIMHISDRMLLYRGQDGPDFGSTAFCPSSISKPHPT